MAVAACLPQMPGRGTAGPSGKRKQRPHPLNMATGDEGDEVLARGVQPQSFDMSTPRGAPGMGSDAARHFIGTPNASSILSAFLDFDDVDAAGPPLEPDFDLINSAAITDCREDPRPGTYADAATIMEVGKPGDDSASSGASTRLEENVFDVAGDAGSDLDAGDMGPHASDDAHEDYEDDFEAESDEDES